MEARVWVPAFSFVFRKSPRNSLERRNAMESAKLLARRRGKCVRYGRGKSGKRVCRKFAKAR